MATKRRSNSSAKKKAQANKAQQQLRSIILFAVAILLLCVVFIKGQHVWKILHDLMFRLFGVMAYFYPILLAGFAVVFSKEKLPTKLYSNVNTTSSIITPI